MTRKRALTLASVVGVSRRYQRSVHLERDLGALGALDGYQLTPAAVRTLDRVISGVGARHGNRAWNLTGPYGSGKSSFLVFLAALLSGGEKTSKDARAKALKLLSASGTQLSRRAIQSVVPLCPMVVTAERAPLGTLVLRGLDDGLARVWSGRRKPRLLGEVSEARKRADSGKLASTRKVVSLVEQVLDLLGARSDGTGVLFIMDEAGKALEYAAHHPRQSDVLLLQELAELAGRSRDCPFVFITVFHQAFAGYAARLGAAQRSEWEKVQGRFEDIPFVEGWDQMVRLVALAVEHGPSFPKKFQTHAKQVVRRSLRHAKLPPVLSGKDVPSQLEAAYPLHPYTTLLLGPLFRSGIFQNERSLFAFLGSREPRAFQEFLREQGSEPGTFDLERLFDYVLSALHTRGVHGGSGMLQAASVALSRVPDAAGRLGAAVVKAMAMIGWLGEKVGLAADLPTLTAAVARHGATQTDVRRTLDALTDASIVVYRKFRSCYLLWEGSDIRLEEVLSRAPSRDLNAAEAALRLNRMEVRQPFVARRHLFETGTLRYFPIRFVAADDLVQELTDPISEGDGRVLVVLGRTNSETEYAEAILANQMSERSPDQRPLITVLPDEGDRLMDLLGELAALDEVGEVEPSFVDDKVAQREVQARKQEIASLLRAELESILGNAPGLVRSRWFVGGKERRVRTTREVTALISEVADEAYSEAPRILNELINRGELSSAAASARRNLLEAMLTRSAEPDLGIEGFPPEKSMYLSLLREHGLHRAESGRFGFHSPSKLARKRGSGAEMYPVWAAWKAAFRGLMGARFALDRAFDIVRRPPFGLKDGVIPVLFVHFYLGHSESLALYENGQFVPSLTPAVMERMLRASKQFELQWLEIGATRSEVLRALGERFQVSAKSEASVPTVLQILRDLAAAITGLPRFAMTTRSLSTPTLKVRETLQAAKEPGPLVFRALPIALGFEPFVEGDAGRDDVEAYVDALYSSMEELEGAYPALLRSLEAQLAKAVSARALRGEDLRDSLAERAARILPLAVGARLKSFLVRAADDTLGREDWIVSLATGLTQKPPIHWSDAERDVFGAELMKVGRMFAEVEALALEAGEVGRVRGGSESRERLVRISVSELGAPTRERVVGIPKTARGHEHLEAELMRVLREHKGELTAEERLASIAAVARALIEEAGSSAHLSFGQGAEEG